MPSSNENMNEYCRSSRARYRQVNSAYVKISTRNHLVVCLALPSACKLVIAIQDGVMLWILLLEIVTLSVHTSWLNKIENGKALVFSSSN